MIETILRERVAADEPALLCDDREEWATRERALRKERRERLLEELDMLGLELRDFSERSWAEMWDEALDDDDYSARGIDDDSGFGPDSYFARSMAKDD